MKTRVSIAPMMAYTDRHFRYFMRLISPQVGLYTEMITAQALLHVPNPERFLAFSEQEHPVAIQLGGSNPSDLARVVQEKIQNQFDEINLNVGCPSDRVQSSEIGACLMAKPQKVAACVKAMQAETSVPVTVKTRIGIDTQDSFEFLKVFTEAILSAGCSRLIVHARKAWLKGLSPKENRLIPTLMPERVYQLKKAFPELEIVFNGEIKTVEQVDAHLRHCDGVMIGRLAYENPYYFSTIEREIFKNTQPLRTRLDVLKEYAEYMGTQVNSQMLLKPLFGLFYGQPGGRVWRRFLSERREEAFQAERLLAQAHRLAQAS